jgi:hypothetical protein
MAPSELKPGADNIVPPNVRARRQGEHQRREEQRHVCVGCNVPAIFFSVLGICFCHKQMEIREKKSHQNK